uniref:Hyphal_reg_CWP domain-containing protein n=1 Tax=Caenorhabditis tropicalis TaxID=1561998 RepID=A0A1I7U9D8_9PELO
MSALQMFSLIFLLFSSCSLVSTSGHLRLELTSSNNCEVRLITGSSDETILLIMGEKRTSSFHFNGSRESLRIGLASPTGVTEFYGFALRNTGQQLRKVFEFSEVVVLIQSVYECDAGYYGIRCDMRQVPTPSTTTTTSTLVITTTPAQSTTADSLEESTMISFFSATADSNSIVILILVFVIFILTALIVVFGVLLAFPSRTQHIIISDTTRDFEKEYEIAIEMKTKEFDDSDEGTEPRYVSEPVKSIYSD